MKILRPVSTLRPLAACLALAFGAPVANAAPPRTSIVVQNCLDHGAGSLRQAVIDDTTGEPIDLTQLTCSTITLTTGRIDVHRSLLIQGSGPDALTINGAGLDRVFQQTVNQPLALYGMTIRNGRTDLFGGGCVYSSGPLQLNNTVVRDCQVADNSSSVSSRGGGVRVQGDLIAIQSAILDNEVYSALGSASGGGASVDGIVVLDHSTISGNLVSTGSNGLASAGGIDIGGRLTMMYSTVSDNLASGISAVPGTIGGLRVMGGATISNSTISGNTANGAKGGIYLYGSVAEQNVIVESTISGNVAGLGIGGLDAIGPTSIRNSTIAFNVESVAGLAAGMRISYAVADLQSTIIAANVSMGGSVQNIGLGTSAGVGGANNLIGPSLSVSLPAGTISGDPKLLPLHDNGGPTRTHALRAGSPAVDAGNNAENYSVDQRGAGFPRIVGAAADIGAHEGVDADSIFYGDFD